MKKQLEKYLVSMTLNYKSKISETRLVAMDAILMSPSISALTLITVQAIATGRSVAMVRM